MKLAAQGTHAIFADMTSGRPHPTLRIARADASTVRPLRQLVLRPGRSPGDVAYHADSVATHFAAYDFADEVVGVATVFPQPYPLTGEAGWRLRGMAVAEHARGSGCGARLLIAVLDHVTAEGGAMLWCNARVSALGFYQRYGLSVDSEVFQVPGGGPHHRMRRALP
jgi:GNAT superfamily N-acetyltransferase